MVCKKALTVSSWGQLSAIVVNIFFPVHSISLAHYGTFCSPPRYHILLDDLKHYCPLFSELPFLSPFLPLCSVLSVKCFLLNVQTCFHVFEYICPLQKNWFLTFKLKLIWRPVSLSSHFTLDAVLSVRHFRQTFWKPVCAALHLRPLVLALLSVPVHSSSLFQN